MSPYEKRYDVGTIIKGKMDHRAVILRYSEDGEPIGVMVTSRGPDIYPCNLIMSESHFEKGHIFGWRGANNPSFMVRHKFLKIREWGKFRRVGKLTPSGIAFIESNIPLDPPIYWRDYITRECNQHPY